MTRDLERLTRSDRRLTSRMKAVARSGSRIIGRCLVGVTQYSCVVVNIFVVFNILTFVVCCLFVVTRLDIKSVCFCYNNKIF